jgi:hypothetical protein
MTREAKRVIDEAKVMSDVRKQRNGVSDDDVKTNHHRDLPKHLTQRISTIDNDVSKPIILLKRYPHNFDVMLTNFILIV